MFWLPGRVLVVFFFGSTVFLTFFPHLPAGCRSPCGVYASVGCAFESVFSFLFFGALPHTRRRVALIFVFLFRLFCPVARMSSSSSRVFSLNGLFCIPCVGVACSVVLFCCV